MFRFTFYCFVLVALALGSSASNSFTSVNGNCNVSNGMVRENGTERPLTAAEKREIEQFNKDMAQYNNSIQQWSQDMARFGASFPFGGGNRRQPVMPKMPRVPCFCKSCK